MLAGCAAQGVRPASDEARAALKAASAIHVMYSPAGAPVIVTPKDAVGSGALAIATKAQDLPVGYTLAERYKYPDAAASMQRRVADKLRADSARRVEVVSTPLMLDKDRIEPDERASAELSKRVSRGLVLVVDVLYNNATYLPFNWQTYRLRLTGRAWLFDADAGRFVWTGTCRADNKGLDLDLDISQFTADGGARAKQVIDAAAGACADEVVTALGGA